MAEELFIPKLGQTVETVTLIAWKVEEGARVEFGQEVLEVETDKAVFPVEANADGFVHLGPFKVGEILPVLTVVAIIGKKDDSFSGGGLQPELSLPGSKPDHLVKSTSGITPGASVQLPSYDLLIDDEEPGKFVSPRARKLAIENGVDLWHVLPTGGGGVRVIERDVRTYMSEKPQELGKEKPADRTKVTPLARRIAEAEGLDLRELSNDDGVITKGDILDAVKLSPASPGSVPAPRPLTEDEVLERIPLKGVRGIIAERMATSLHTTARVTMFMDADATQFVHFRQRLKERYAKEWGFAPGYNDLLAKICAAALRRFPYMNARLMGDSIEHLKHVNIGIAVDTERGLLVPVIRDADLKPVEQAGQEFRQMVERARAGRSQFDDLTGGTFTITNLGMYDVDSFTPVINLPEAAILGVGRITPRPVYIGSELVRREMMNLSLVFDHRLVDGAPAARFMQYIRDLIEDPALLGVL